MDQKTVPRFEFGRNWIDFIERNFSQERVDIAKKHMLAFIGRERLDGLSFLDIGCGSGLHALAALQSGADSVHGFDYDPNSVEAARWCLTGRAERWTIERGSVLDDAYMERLPQYDVVYSWGVLHHTGEVWHAIRNAALRVKPGGLMYLALYSADVQIDPTPEFWLKVKRMYVSSGWLVRRLMMLWYLFRFEYPSSAGLPDTWLSVKSAYASSGWLTRYRMALWYIWRKYAWHGTGLGRIWGISEWLLHIREKSAQYQMSRGMSLFNDIHDWLGGWPMEFVRDADAVKYCENLGFCLEKIATGEANTEFLFVRV